MKRLDGKVALISGTAGPLDVIDGGWSTVLPGASPERTPSA
ncbi:hypothetical protein ACN6K9_001596 [Streptomyces sp. SAS_267]